MRIMRTGGEPEAIRPRRTGLPLPLTRQADQYRKSSNEAKDNFYPQIGHRMTSFPLQRLEGPALTGLSCLCEALRRNSLFQGVHEKAMHCIGGSRGILQ